MPVNAPHDAYTSHILQWTRIRDVLSGSDAVKGKRTLYLPKPNGHDGDDYEGYVTRAEFYPATQRTVDGLAGAVFRKDPTFEGPDSTQPLLDQTTLRGNDFTGFSKAVIREVLSLGRYGALVDVTQTGDNGMPFVAGYTAENIVNWRVTYVNRSPIVSLVVLREMRAVIKEDDPFVTDQREQYRVLVLAVPEGQSEAVYMQQVWVKSVEGGRETWAQTEEAVPLRRGKPLDRIPFVFFGPMDLTAEVQKSPILDLVDTNLSHYRTSAELEEGAYFTGLPMYVVSGRPQGKGPDSVTEFAVGSRSALMLEEGGTAEVLTVDGDGMGVLRDLMEGKEKRMAVLGARILEDQKAGVEAGITVAMRHRGENSLLSSISDTCSRGLTRVLRLMVWWNGADNTDDVRVELNQDFTSLQMTGEELVKLTSAFQLGSIGPEVFFKALKDGERVPADWTKDDWLADIEEGATGLERMMANEDA